jgi:Ca-activated chloride channel family protein
MKKQLSVFMALIIAVALFANPVLADGIIIIDPPVPPPPDWSPWLTIRYHRVHVDIADQVATTRIDQVFRNDSPVAAEGTYVFPLPPGAVVQEFLMWVDGKAVEGEILPAEEARTIYEDYVRRQQDPALLEYVGRDAIQARIFPIPTGEERRIEIEYTQVLPLENGLLHYRYPLDTERFSNRPLEQVSIEVEIDSPTRLGALYSSTHQDDLFIQREGERKATVSYEANDITPDRDFELHIGFSNAMISANLLTFQQSREDGFFLLMLSPHLEAESRIQPKDLFLILDTSGSMEGEKIEQAKEALRYILDHLNPEDRFNVISFSSGVQPYARTLKPASEAAEAARWVSRLEPLGGTNIYLALSEALRQADSERPTVVIFLTDGLPTEGIIEEQSLLDALRQEAPSSVRIFPFGVGYDVNTLLLDQLAEDHRGRPSYVQPGERIDEVVSAFYARVQSPLLTDIALDFKGIEVYDLYPQPLPDLYAGTQLIVTGRYEGGGPGEIELSGTVEGKPKTFVYGGEFVSDPDNDFIPRLWAARKIGHLLTQIRLHGENQEWIDAVVTLSLRYGIITPYTSFLIEEQDDVLTSESREEAAEKFMAMPTPAAYGEQAVQDAESRLGLGGAQAMPPTMELPAVGEGGDFSSPTAVIKYAGDKTFLCKDAICTDTLFVPDQMDTIDVRFASDSYWQLLTSHPEWAGYLALSPEVIFVAADGTAYHVHTDPDAAEDVLPLSPATPVPNVTEGAAEATASTESPQAAPGGRDLCSGAMFLALLGLALAFSFLRP